MYIENVKKGIRINLLVPVGLLFLFLLNPPFIKFPVCFSFVIVTIIYRN